MRLVRNIASLLLIGAGIAGCSKSADEIAPSYVSVMQYQHYSCDQLKMEAMSLSRRASQLSGVQNDKATEDALLMTASIIVFWPAAFFIGGDGQSEAELARLKGEFEAVESAAIQKNCAFEFRKR